MKKFIISQLVIFTLLPAIAIAATPFTHNFGRGATDSSTGGEVTRLQKILAQDKVIYPEGIVSGYFGTITERAVQRFQAKNKIVTSGTPATTGYGFIGPKTRTILNGDTSFSGQTNITNTGDKFKIAIFPNTIDVPKPETINAVKTNQFSMLYNSPGTTTIKVQQIDAPQGISFNAPSSCYSPCLLSNKITVAKTVPEGKYPITVKATVGQETVTANYTISVNNPNKFSFGVHASGQISVQKSISGSISGKNDIRISLLSGDPRTVTITQKPSISGIKTANLGTCTVPCTKSNSVTIGYDVPSGIYSVAVTVAGGGATTSMTYSVNVAYNPNFGFHISGEEKDKTIIVTQPASAPVSVTIPIYFLLDGGSPQTAKISLTEPSDITGISAGISASSCLLPCQPSLTMTVNPGAKVGSGTATVKGMVEYTDETGKKITVNKTYSVAMKVILGNPGTVQQWSY